MPNIERPLPKRVKDRIEMQLPKWMKSSSEKLDPRRARP
jgi:hypothetical protein